ncbi:MAG: hypothetical protein EOO45_21740 [Flavobacterium sp.]|nr:MAG: hypothetical protein EOO45_21740 [Flavobacterium sp.]
MRTMYALLLDMDHNEFNKPQQRRQKSSSKVSDEKPKIVITDRNSGLDDNVAVPNFDEGEKKDDTNKIYIMPDLESGPTFPGGNNKFTKYFEGNFNKNAVAKSGWISFDFIVEKDGGVTFKALRSPAKDIEDEATRVLNKMPKWTPGKRKGEPVRSTFTQMFTVNKS